MDQKIESIVGQIVAAYGKGRREAVMTLAGKLKDAVHQSKPRTKEETLEENMARKMALDDYESDDISFDENPAVSIGNDGAFVQAWVWVPGEDFMPMVACKFCGCDEFAKYARLHDGKWVCRDCWDSRLENTE
jgi:hypothetical protein